MVLLGFKCFISPGRARLWCCLRLNVPFPREGEAVVLLAFKCFSSPGRAKLWCCLRFNVSVPLGGRGCGVACV